jgi:hypothetical protein
MMKILVDARFQQSVKLALVCGASLGGIYFSNKIFIEHILPKIYAKQKFKEETLNRILALCTALEIALMVATTSVTVGLIMAQWGTIEGFVLELVGLVASSRKSYHQLVVELFSKDSWFGKKVFKNRKSYDNFMKLKFDLIKKLLGIENDEDIKLYTDIDINMLQEFVEKIKALTLKKLNSLKGFLALIRTTPEFPVSAADLKAKEEMEKLIEMEIKNNFDFINTWQKGQLETLKETELAELPVHQRKYLKYLLQLLLLILFSEGSLFHYIVQKLFKDIPMSDELKEKIKEIIRKYLRRRGKQMQEA